MDKRFLDKYCPKFVSALHYRIVDVSTVKARLASGPSREGRWPDVESDVSTKASTRPESVTCGEAPVSNEKHALPGAHCPLP